MRLEFPWPKSLEQQVGRSANPKKEEPSSAESYDDESLMIHAQKSKKHLSFVH